MVSHGMLDVAKGMGELLAFLQRQENCWNCKVKFDVHGHIQVHPWCGEELWSRVSEHEAMALTWAADPTRCPICSQHQNLDIRPSDGITCTKCGKITIWRLPDARG